MILKSRLIIVFIGCAALFFIIINNFKGSSDGSGVSSVTDANKYLNGKTFIATPRGNVWYKLSFSENSCKLLTGVPQYEGWDVAYSGIYSIQEGRYSDTGQLHYYVKFGNDESLSNCFMFDIKNKSLYVCMNGNSPLAVMEIGDRDPWN
jgi:hypothetical protein